MLSVWTNEGSTTKDQIKLGYQKNIDLSSTISPKLGSSNATNYLIGVAGKFLVKALIDDPVNSFFAYLFIIDNNLNSGTFGVFKMDFTPTVLKYAYTTLSMSSGLFFSVNSITKTSQTDPNDFYFAGKARDLTDGKTTQSFTTG